MNNQQILRADYLDILFEGRNKCYGGYLLRKTYSRRARSAMLAVLAGLSALIAVPVIASALEGETRTMPTTEKPYLLAPPPDLNPLKPLPQPVSAPKPPVATVQDAVLIVVHDDKVTDPPPADDELSNKQVGLHTTEGTGIATSDVTLPAGGGNDETALVESPAEDRIIYTKVEMLPQFPGDIDEYLARHLRYPDASRETGEEGRTVIQFIVNTDGGIQDAVVVRSAAPLLDAEALRVVRTMPQWKPGRQAGKAVRVQFAIPISWHLSN